MKIVGRNLIKGYVASHSDSAASLRSWVRLVEGCGARNFVELRKAFRRADAVGGEGCVIFNIAHNRYRLAARAAYKAQLIRIQRIMTHKEYDKWKGCT